MTVPIRFHTALTSAVLAFLSFPAAAADNLLLRVNDTMGTPGGPAVITLRTYASRPVGQGTICFVFRSFSRDGNRGASLPLIFKKSRVFSTENDVFDSVNVREVGGEMIIDVTFSSPSATVNSVDGPVAALYFDVAPDAVPGWVSNVSLDLSATSLFDPDGDPVVLETRGGEMAIRHPSAPVQVAAEADLPDIPGDPVTLSLQTNEPFRIATGQVVIRYSNRELLGQPTLRHDARFGSADIKLDGIPGMAVFNILASDVGFNELPGNIISVDLRQGVLFGDGYEPYVVLDPELTHLFDDQGNSINIAIENAVPALPSAAPAPQQNRSKQN